MRGAGIVRPVRSPPASGVASPQMRTLARFVWVAFAGIVVWAALAAPASTRPAASVTVSSVSVDASWKESWLTATLTFSGTVDTAAQLTIFVRPADRPGNVAAKTTLPVAAAGAFTGQLRLPARLLPGAYTLRVTGTSTAGDLAPVDTPFTVPAPAEGIVDKAGVSTRKGGPFVDRVQGTVAALWARFHFVVPPQTKVVEISWYTPSFKFVDTLKKPYKATVESVLANATGHLEPGTWYAIAKVGGKVVKRARLKIV